MYGITLGISSGYYSKQLMEKPLIVLKSSGISEPFNPTKLRRVLSFACENTTINPDELLQDVIPLLVDGMSSKQIQKTVIKYTADRISPEEPDYQYVSARLASYALRKDVYGQYEPVSLQKMIDKNVEAGIYDEDLRRKWSRLEIDELDSYIDHTRDCKFAYAGIMQFKEKYLCKNRSTGEIFETPQIAYMLIAMCLHQEEQTNRIEKVVKFYNVTSTHKLSLPTPILVGVRTPTRQFSSCVKIEVGDDLDSIGESGKSILRYISQRAGIGLNAGGIRAEGSRVRSGEVKHTGVIPFWKYLHAAVKSCCLKPETYVEILDE